MSIFQVYDKPMCCSTGVCGTDVDPVLPRFAADLEWLKTLGHTVTRYNLAQQPEAFIENPEVRRLVMVQGVKPLPMVVVDGRVVSQGIYPSRSQLADWAGSGENLPTLSVTSTSPPSCCGPDCC